MKTFDDNQWEKIYALAQAAPENPQTPERMLASSDMRSETLIASGGMKRIYSCRDPKTGRNVALARLLDPDSESMRARFLREGKILANLQHPNIVPLYSLDESGPDGPSFTMKLLGGQTLESALGSNNLSLHAKLEIFIKICDGVAYAHNQGVVHLDLKPGNVQLGEFGEVLVYDWGLAGFISGDEFDEERFFESEDLQVANRHVVTLHGEVRGTPGFLAPEQAMGNASAKDQRTDVYALGAILYTMLTGEPPLVNAEVYEVIERTRAGDVPAPSSLRSGIPLGLEAVCLKAMHLAPERRYQRVSELAAEIESYRSGFAPEAENASLFKVLLLLYRRHRRFFVTAGISIAVIVGISTNAYRQLQTSEQEARASEAKAIALMNQVLAQREEKHQIAQSLDGHISQQIDHQYMCQDFAELRRLVKVGLALDPTSAKALRYSAFLHLVDQQFDDYFDTLKAAEPALRLELEAVTAYLQGRSSANSRMSPEELADFVRRFGPRHPELAVRLLGQAFADGLPIEDHMDLLHAGFRLHNETYTGAGVSWDAKRKELSLIRVTNIHDLTILARLAVTILDLSHTSVTHLETLPLGGVKRLKLRYCELDSVEALFGCPVEYLDIRGASIADQEIRKLVREKHLKEIVVNPRQIPTETISLLTRASIKVTVDTPPKK